MNARLVTAHRSTFIRDVLRISGVARRIFVVGEARSATELVELCRTEQADVVYAEDSFDDGSDIEAVLVLLVATGARVIVVCDDEKKPVMLDFWATWCTGCKLLEQNALHDPRVVRLAGALVAARVDCSKETPRVRALYKRYGVQGLPAKSIARRLGMAVKTVENHKIRIYDKLGVRTQAHAVSLAISHGLLTGTGVATVAAVGAARGESEG